METLDEHYKYLLILLKRACCEAFVSSDVQVNLDRPNEELAPLPRLDEYDFVVTLHNHAAGFAVEIFRGNWTRCMRWIRTGEERIRW